jgi:putative flippase GtrA
MTVTLSDVAERIGESGVATVVDIVIPVHNEEAELEASVRRLRAYLDAHIPFSASVVIADNASTDATWAIAQRLSGELEGVRGVRLAEKGRGRALRATWLASNASVLAYMDVDLATDLDALLPLIAPLVSGHSDLAIGSRLARGSQVVRGPKRELISRVYNMIIRAALGNGFTDAQCGFKAIRSDAVDVVLPLVEDQAWFFDTEVLVTAQRLGLRIHEVPVDWVDDPDSRVDITSTAMEDLRGIWRLRKRWRASPPSGTGIARRLSLDSQLGQFAGIGILSTLAYLLLFVALNGPLGAYGANAVALVICTLGNTAAHRWITFANQGRLGVRAALAGIAAVLATSLVFTMAGLAIANLLAPGSVGVEVVALLVASGFAALVRFVLLRAWVFRTHLRALHTNGTTGEGSPPG